MKKLLLLIVMSLAVCLSVRSQQPGIEKEAWDFASQYDQAILRMDVSFLEQHLAANFISIGGNSSIMNKEQCIENIRRELRKDVDFTVIDLKSMPIKFITFGNTVVVTSTWKVARKANSVANAPVQVDKGITTAVYRRDGDGNWQLLSEHVSFDRPPETDRVGEIGRQGMASFRALVSRNYADLERMLTDNYVRVDEDGTMLTRDQYLTALRSKQLVIEGVKPEKVYINTRENAAVENGIITLVGKLDGVAFTKTVEYTRRWQRLDDKWKIAATYFNRQ